MSAVPVPVADVQIVPLGGDQVAAMVAIQDTVCAQLPLPELYFPLSLLELQELVGPDGLCVGAKAGGRLIGFFGVVYMGEREDNIGYDLGLAVQDLASVAYFKATNVLPAHRGMGLQRRMTRDLLTRLRPCAWLTSTVSPRNLASLKSFLDCGFWIQGLKPKYLGNMRYLMLRKRQNSAHPLTDSTAVPLLDYDTQVDLLARGWRGVALDGEHATARIHYIRAKG